MFEMAMAAAASATQAREDAQRPAWPLNPFPSGVRAWSVTDRVLSVLKAEPGRWFEHNELMRLTGGSRGAIAWAVRYLQGHGIIRSVPSARNRSYRRYQLTPGGGHD